MPVVLWQLPFSCRCARTAATTTGMYSARQPAITALIAACSAVTTTSRVGTSPSTVVGRELRGGEEPLDQLGRRRHHREAVGPAAVVVVVDQGGVVGVLVARRGVHACL